MTEELLTGILNLNTNKQNNFYMFQNVDNVDKENLSDPAQVANYVKDVFDYYKEREVRIIVLHPILLNIFMMIMSFNFEIA